MKSKLSGGNLVHGVNTWAVLLLRYSAAFVSRRKSELQAMDRKTRKFTIYGALHPKSDVDIEILGWCPVQTFLTHAEKVPL